MSRYVSRFGSEDYHLKKKPMQNINFPISDLIKHINKKDK